MPCIRGLRMTVADVLDYLAAGMSEDDLLREFPDLTREDIRACLAFAADRERQLVAGGGVRMPFAVRDPNATTVRAMKEVADGKGRRFGSAAELFRDLFRG